MALWATTLNRYSVPEVSPATLQEVVADSHVTPSGVETTVYPVIGEPFPDGLVQVTYADLLPPAARGVATRAGRTEAELAMSRASEWVYPERAPRLPSSS